MAEGNQEQDFGLGCKLRGIHCLDLLGRFWQDVGYPSQEDIRGEMDSWSNMVKLIFHDIPIHSLPCSIVLTCLC